jgi:hypothetical protein
LAPFCFIFLFFYLPGTKAGASKSPYSPELPGVQHAHLHERPDRPKGIKLVCRQPFRPGSGLILVPEELGTTYEKHHGKKESRLPYSGHLFGQTPINFC